jgi:hypothetical protein
MAKKKTREGNLAMFTGALHRSGAGKSLQEVADAWNVKYPDDPVDVSTIIREHKAAVEAVKREHGPYAEWWSLRLAGLGTLDLPIAQPGRPTKYPGLGPLAVERKAAGMKYKDIRDLWNSQHPDNKVTSKQVEDAARRERKKRAK